jgi:hypothetical protein
MDHEMVTGARNAPKAPLFDPPYRFQLIRKAAA